MSGTGPRERWLRAVPSPSGPASRWPTYVGHQAGERILAGRIRRGDIAEIHAAFWPSDMRGFTS